MHMKSKLGFGLVILLIMTTTACGEQTSKTSPDSNSGQGAGGSGKVPGKGCWIYQGFGVADCKALVGVNALAKASRSQYKYPTSSDARYAKPTHMIDLSAIDLNQHVTKNFKLNEFMQEHKGRYAYFAEHVFGFIQKVRDQIGGPIHVTSAYRSPAYNKKIKGAALSRHMYGDALDIAGAPLSEMQAACRSAGASFIQLYADGHIHCDWRSHPLDRKFYQNMTLAPEIMAEKMALTSEAEYTQMQMEFSGVPEIDLDGDVKVGKKIELTAHLEEKEESGELFTEWIVRYPSGSVRMSNDNPIEIELTESGLYSISVRMGGYAEAHYELNVN